MMVAFNKPNRPITQDTWVAGAVHELGHAFAANEAGWEIAFVELGRKVVKEGIQVGRCVIKIDHLLEPDSNGKLVFPSDYSFRVRYAVYSAAGPIAEYLLLKNPPARPSCTDQQFVLEDAQTLFPDDPAAQREFIRQVSAMAGRVVRGYEKEIRYFAPMLLARGRLEGSEIQDWTE